MEKGLKMTLGDNSDSRERIALFTCGVQMPTLQMGKQNLREAQAGHTASKRRPESMSTWPGLAVWLPKLGVGDTGIRHMFKYIYILQILLKSFM